MKPLHRYCVRHENTNNPPKTQEVMRHPSKLRTSKGDDTSALRRHGIGHCQLMFAAQAWSPAICHGSGQNTGLPALASAIA